MLNIHFINLHQSLKDLKHKAIDQLIVLLYFTYKQQRAKNNVNTEYMESE